MKNLHALFLEEIKDAYGAEKQILEALPKMAKKASSEKLQKAFETHLKQTEEQKERLEKIAEQFDLSLEKAHCTGMEGLLEEGAKMMEKKMEPVVMDAALIGAAQRVEHYEIAAYGTLCAYAELMEHDDALDPLKETLEEEAETDELLTEISEEVNAEANTDMNEE